MSRATPVLIVGASARAFAQSAQRSGHTVHAADDFADFDTGQVAQIIQRDSPRAMLATIPHPSPIFSAYVGGWENQVSQVAELEQTSILLGNPAAVLRELHDPIQLLEWVERQGFRVPRILLSEPGSASAVTCSPPPAASSNAASSNAAVPVWLHKKFRSCGGLGIAFHAPSTSQPRSPAEPMIDAPGAGCYFQEFIPGRSLSAIYVAWRSGSRSHCRLLGISHQLSGDRRFNAQGFQYTGSIIQPRPNERLLEYARALGTRLVERFGLRGLFNIDFIEAPDDCYFLEINPRYSASMELWERGTGVNLFELQKAACREQADATLALIGKLEQVTAAWSVAGPWIGKAIWYADRPLLGNPAFIRRAINYNRQSEQAGNRWASVADLPSPQVAIRPGGPAFTVFDSGESLDAVTEKLRKTARMLASGLEPQAAPH